MTVFVPLARNITGISPYLGIGNDRDSSWGVGSRDLVGGGSENG